MFCGSSVVVFLFFFSSPPLRAVWCDQKEKKKEIHPEYRAKLWSGCHSL